MRGPDNSPAMSDEQQHNQGGPLRGIRVLDLTRVLAGPWASQLLADYGADVIKVERPGGGDDTRAWGPPWLKDTGGDPTPDSAYFLASNRNKRSMTANLAHPRGAGIVRDLAARADVVMENFKVGTLSRFGLGYEQLKAVNPAVVFCSITAYGQQGSRAGKPGYDAMMQASGGLMSITGEPDEHGGSPLKVGVAIADIMAGMYATTAILAALVARDVSGAGQQIDVPLYDSQVAWLANQNMNYLVGGECPGRLGTAHPNLVPYQAFPTADGHLMLAVGNDRQFAATMACLGRGELADDARFASNAARIRNRDALIELMTAEFRSHGTVYWLDELAGRGVPAGPINTIAEVFSETYAKERELVRPIRHTNGKDVQTVANPVRFSATPVEYRRAPPMLGEHTAEILTQELGFSCGDVDSLRDTGAI
jgi:crotonobetainyl-CoA:carnitine CoA-transferase CaiB-like acyl-CoA transferase